MLPLCCRDGSRGSVFRASIELDPSTAEGWPCIAAHVFCLPRGRSVQEPCPPFLLSGGSRYCLFFVLAGPRLVCRALAARTFLHDPKRSYCPRRLCPRSRAAEDRMPSANEETTNKTNSWQSASPLCFFSLKIHQRGVQWKQGVGIYMMLYTSLLYNTTPIHCTPLPLHPL